MPVFRSESNHLATKKRILQWFVNIRRAFLHSPRREALGEFRTGAWHKLRVKTGEEPEEQRERNPYDKTLPDEKARIKKGNRNYAASLSLSFVFNPAVLGNYSFSKLLRR